MKYTKCILALLLVSTIGLTACNSNHDTQVSTAIEKAPNSSMDHTKSNTNESDAPATSQTNLSGNQSTDPVNRTSNTSGSEDNNPNKSLIHSIMQSANQGKVENCEFAADSSLIDDIEKKWGKPDREDAAGQGLYATYTQRNLAFGFNKGGQVFDVRSYDAGLKQITYMDVERVLGKPAAINHYKDQDILVYQASDTFELEWVFPKPSKQEANPKLDHISVFCPKDATNIMAAQ